MAWAIAPLATAADAAEVANQGVGGDFLALDVEVQDRVVDTAVRSGVVVGGVEDFGGLGDRVLAGDHPGEGVAFGVVSYVVLKFATGRRSEVHTLLYVFAVLFVARYALLR